MRILVYCDEDLGTASGGTRQVLEFSRALAAQGSDVRIIAPTPRAGGTTGLIGIPLRSVPVIRTPGLRPLSYLILSGVAMAWEMVRWRPHVLLWFDSPGQFSPLVCATLSRCPYVLFVNGLPAEELQGPWNFAPVRSVLTGMLKLTVRRAAAIVSVCDEIVRWMQGAWAVPPERCHVIRNGVDPEVFSPGDPVAARRSLRLTGPGPYVGFVGGFFPWHGLDLLIQAIPLVRRTIPGVCFLLVGDGQTRAMVETLAGRLGVRDACVFSGRVPLDEVPLWIGAADVCVVLNSPTRLYAGDSMKLWEYLACARPVVATAGPGFGDAVEAMGSGVAVKINDVEGLAQALIHLLRDPEERAGMGERGRAAVEQAHTWDARAAALESLLEPMRRNEAHE